VKATNSSTTCFSIETKPSARYASDLWSFESAASFMGCGKLSVFFSDGCEVGYSDVVAEGFEVEFASLGCSLVAG